MPRIRTLKPEHKQHHKVGRLSHRQYRLWVGMITEADDEGRLVADASSLRVMIFGYHPDVTDEDVAVDLARLHELGLVKLYRGKAPSAAVNAHSVSYASFPDWLIHQRIDRPRKSQLPAPTIHERSSKPRRTLAESSPIIREGSDLIGPDTKGSDPKGEASEAPTNGLVTLTAEEEKGLPYIAQARGITVAQCRSELMTAKLREVEQRAKERKA